MNFTTRCPSKLRKTAKETRTNSIEEEILTELIKLHRKQDHFWGR